MSEERYDETILVQIAQIAMGPLPTDFSAFGKMIWDAFRSGREYEKIVAKREAQIAPETRR